jgi:hypothetical protein
MLGKMCGMENCGGMILFVKTTTTLLKVKIQKQKYGSRKLFYLLLTWFKQVNNKKVIGWDSS